MSWCTTFFGTQCIYIYMSIAVRNNMHFVLYRYCCEGRHTVNIHLKCLEKSENLKVTGE